MQKIKDMVEPLTQIAPVVSALAAIGAFIFALKSYLRLRSRIYTWARLLTVSS